LCHEICCWLMIYAIFLIPHVLASVSLLKTQRDHQVLQNALLHGNLAPSNFFLIFFSHFDLNLFKYKELELSCSLWFFFFFFFFFFFIVLKIPLLRYWLYGDDYGLSVALLSLFMVAYVVCLLFLLFIYFAPQMVISIIQIFNWGY